MTCLELCKNKGCYKMVLSSNLKRVKRVKKLAKIAEAGLGSYVFNKIMGFFVGAHFGRLSVLSRVEGPHRSPRRSLGWRDDSNSHFSRAP